MALSPTRLVATLLVAGCASRAPSPLPPPSPVPPPTKSPAAAPPSAFDDDVALLKEQVDVVVLKQRGGEGRVAVVPAYQGRVMTSTAGGSAPKSFGWIHRENVAKNQRQPHMTVLGGEDRFWLGPEGGQYALYFAPGDPYDLAHWQVPQPIDWGAWPVVEQTEEAVRFRTTMNLVNHAGTELSLAVDRTITVLPAEELDLPEGARAVCFASENRITNTGDAPWTKETGLVSIWILGMFNPSSATTVAVPFRSGSEEELGPVLNDAYFGPVPEDRLKVLDGAVVFRADGQRRGKIGIPRPRAIAAAGSFDAAGEVLTLVRYTLPDDATDYVNSMWEDQEAPYGGDVVNSYNDGPPAPGEPPLGPFYELETSSPAAALAPGESLSHRHETCHIQGPRPFLDGVAKDALGLTTREIAKAFPAK